ncbi:MAG: hypothetical protein HY393_02860 [Candidatus Diapherotrites archaeon]|nr:hypothetical protein [Candidatus Diapherotrites archaeon]
MGHLTVSVDKHTEQSLRALAKEKYAGKKGAISKVVMDAVERMAEENHRQRAVESLKAMMEKGFPMGKILVKHRSELYDRK